MSYTPVFRASILAIAILASSLTIVSIQGQSAFAHDSVIETVPADGEHTAVAPTEVSMSFTDSILTIGATINVIDSAGTNWSAGDVVIDDRTAVQPLAAELAAGEYDVIWQVVSSDGHVISGTFGFSTGDLSAAATTDAAAAGPNVAASTTGAAASSEQTRAGMTDPILPLWFAGILGAIGGVLIYGAGVLIHRRTTRT